MSRWADGRACLPITLGANRAYWTYSLNIFKKCLKYTRIYSNIFNISLSGGHAGLMDKAGGRAVRAGGHTYNPNCV